MLKILVPEAVIFLVYVVCLNLKFDGLLGNTIICMTMTGFIMSKLAKIEDKNNKKERK